MSPSTSRHEWLRRVSDYHGGGVTPAERVAVEQHLATCQECQEALAMYHRFYSLLRSPLRLGPPSVHFDEDTIINDEATRPPRQPATSRPPRRSRSLATIAAVVAATLVIAGFLAVYATRNGNPASTSTPTPRATSTAESTTTAEPNATAQPGSFVCANPPGSNLIYAYQRGDGGIYTVTGCADPVRVGVSAFSSPLVWSPSGRYLAIQAASANTTFPLVIYDMSNSKLIATKFDVQAPSSANPGAVVRTFLGWVDDNTFLGAIQPVAAGNPNAPFGTSTIVKVNVASQTETRVGSIAWFADTKIIAPGYLFYGGLQNMSEGQAYLHQLDLSNGADSKLVPLGEYGNGGCQGTPFCNWTAPWDVSPDATQIIYHSPGPTTLPSDINVVKDTPLVLLSRIDLHRSTPFGVNLAASLSKPSFSPQGRYIVATGVTDRQVQQGDQWFRLLQGSVTDVHGIFTAWRGDNLALVILATSSPQPSLYTIASQTTSALEPNSNFYFWAPLPLALAACDDACSVIQYGVAAEAPGPIGARQWQRQRTGRPAPRSTHESRNSSPVC